MSGSASIAELRREVLRSVSRSFYLSIRLLPRQLRDPIALAYLLARATDTIADTAEIDAELRLRHLDELTGLLQGNGSEAGTERLRDSFAPLQRDPAERRLVESLPLCIRWLQSTAEADQQDIRHVLGTITEGQRFDLQHFGNATEISALQTAADLDRYTYLVAGCVGEFWTQVCCRHLQSFASLPAERMRSLGIDYGKGLQLINILRDAGADLRAGRCYLPADELGALGLSPAGLAANARGADPLLKNWRERAQHGIAAGIEYSCAIRPWRVRLATVLPALIGARTLGLLGSAGEAALQQKVKMSRSEVRRILFRMIISLASPGAIRALFAQLSSGNSTENTAAASR